MAKRDVKTFLKIVNRLNQRGMGLIGVLVAAALVVIAAFTTANFVSDQHHQSAKLQISGDCQNIANSLVEYIKKDEASLFISSYGPVNNQRFFPPNLDTTADGIDRFNFGPTQTPTFISSTPTDTNPIMNITTKGSTRLETVAPGWKYYNHLNIKNSVNRLVALAASENYCCDGLNMNNPNCGARFYDNTKPVPGFSITDRDVEVDLGIDFKGTNCVSQKLSMNDLPDSRSGTVVDFKVRVTMKRGTAQQKICEGTGVVQRTSDTVGSQTVLQFTRTELCQGSTNTPAVCGALVPVTFRVRTFKDVTTGSCSTNCIGATRSKACNALSTPTSLNLFNTFDDPACTSACQESEPGVSFLCRIGVKSWFDDPLTQNIWEPCETARVWDHNGSPTAGRVSITYDPLITDDDFTNKTSNAIITLNDLANLREYKVDVRALDTAGNIGPSFCNNSPSCAAEEVHFSIINATPSFGPLSDGENRVGGTAQAVLGRNTTVTSITPRYTGALAPFSGQKFQCQGGNLRYRGPITYNPAPPTPLTHTCVASYTRTDGTMSGLPCSCPEDPTLPDYNHCSTPIPGVATNGNYNVSITVSNACNTLPPVVDNWCLDDGTTPIGATITTPLAFGSTPNFTGAIAKNPRPCGVATLCPNADGVTFTSTTGTCPAPAGWNPVASSGCLQDPSANYCAIVIDPCGRFQETSPPGISYSTLMAAGGANQCFNHAGTPVGGNFCEGGSSCTRLGKCSTTCAKGGQPCSAATDCDDPSYGVTSGQPGGPTCAGTCTCPSNATTPAAGPCGQVYCPVLNSCRLPANGGPAIGSTPPMAGVACQACENWVTGPWSLCISGYRTRSVTCPSSCCIGPQPPTSITCPDCITPWGTDFLHGTSITAYQAPTVGCGGNCGAISETRTCLNGVVSGSFVYPSCSVDACAGCALPWGGAIGHGQSVTAYGVPTVACGSSCGSVAQTRTCSNGSLSGTATAASCSVDACPPPGGGCAPAIGSPGGPTVVSTQICVQQSGEAERCNTGTYANYAKTGSAVGSVGIFRATLNWNSQNYTFSITSNSTYNTASVQYPNSNPGMLGSYSGSLPGGIGLNGMHVGTSGSSGNMSMSVSWGTVTCTEPPPDPTPACDCMAQCGGSPCGGGCCCPSPPHPTGYEYCM